MNNENVRVCMITNRYLDEDYIEEWCENYYRLGFTFIYLLEDLYGNVDGKLFIDMPYIKDKVDKGLMSIIGIENRVNQWDLYPWFYNNTKNQYDWCALFDSDELLTLNKHKTIQDFLNDDSLDFNACDVIQISWKNFTDNGYTHKQNGLVRDIFTEWKEKNVIETKIILRGGLETTKFFIGHACIPNNNLNRIKYSDGTVIGRFSPFHAANYEIASLNHYYCKSTEEFIKRKSMGRLDIPNWSRTKALEGFMGDYFNISEKTDEKVAMFNNMFSELSEKEGKEQQ